MSGTSRRKSCPDPDGVPVIAHRYRLDRLRYSGWLLLAGVAACVPDPVPTGEPGAALPQLTDQQISEFQAGRALFARSFTPEEGLGPAFNDNECSACHDLPTVGGAGADHVTKATRFENGRCDLLTDAGGDLLQSQATPLLGKYGMGPESVPRRANAVASISPPPLFGMGAIEAIPDEAILRRADPDDRNGDGISGRPGVALNGGLGRFGRKATFATIHDFVASALSGEMGLTTSGFPHEEPVAGVVPPASADPHSDPELSDEEVGQLTRFVEFLAPPGRPELTSAALDSVSRGERLFASIGCTACHTPSLPTRKSPVAALSHRRVRLFSDLLLHDLGPELASVCSPAASPSEWRTSPLLGLRFRLFFMHQGQAASLEKAIRMHGGEAENVRMRFEALSPAQQAFLLRFVSAL